MEFTLPDSADLSAIVAETTQLSQEAGSAATWTEAHDAVQEALKASGSHRPFAEQTAAYAMLQNHFGHLSETTPSDTEVQALGEYMEMLLDNRSPESDMVYPALQILHSHWSEQRLVAAIDTTLQASRRQYIVNPKAVDAHIPDVHDEIRRANQNLVQLRNRLRAE